MRRSILLSLILLLAGAAAVAVWLRWNQDPPADSAATTADAMTDRGSAGYEAARGDESSSGRTPVRTSTGGNASGSDGARSRALSGRVVGANGERLAGARVTLHRVSGAWPAWERSAVVQARCGGDGSFRFTDLPSGQLLVSAVHDDHALGEVLVARGMRRVLVELERGFEVSGVVVDSVGRPVVEAEVILDAGGYGLSEARAVPVDRRGEFVFRNVPAGSAGVVSVMARHPSLAPMKRSNIAVATATGLRLELSDKPGQVFEARAFDTQGRPVVGAELRIYPDVRWNARLGAPYVTKSDAEGRLVLAGLPNSNVTAELSHPDYSSARRVLSLRRAEHEDFELVPRVEVLGVARADGLESALGGVQLELTDRFGLRALVELRADGTFEFASRMSEGPAELEVVGGALAFAETGSRRTSVFIEDREQTRLELDLVAASVVSGRIVDRSGEPLAGAEISAPRYSLQRRNPERWSEMSASSGRFTLRGLAAGEHVLFCDVPGLGEALVEVQVPSGSGGEAVDVGNVVVAALGGLRGQVWRNGEPLAGASIVASSDQLGVHSAVSDGSGRFEMHALPPGDYRVFARWSTLPIRPAEGAIKVRAGQFTEGLQFEFSSGRPLRGSVTDESGAVVVGAQIIVVESPAPPAITDEQGRFEMQVPEGDVRLDVAGPETREFHPFAVPGEQTEVDIKLPYVPRAMLQARVLGLPGDHPLRAVVLRVEPSPREGESLAQLGRRRVSSSRRETQRGELRWSGLPAGPAVLTLSAPGFTAKRFEIDAARDATVDLGTIRLEPGARLEGVAVTSDGEAVGGAMVLLGQAEALEYPELHGNHTASDGRFEVQGVGPHSRRLIVFKPGYIVCEVDLQYPDVLLSGEPLRVELHENARLELQLMRGGQPVETPQLVAIEKDGNTLLVRLTDVQGKLQMQVNRCGDFRLYVLGRREQGQDITIPPTGGSQRVELVLD